MWSPNILAQYIGILGSIIGLLQMIMSPPVKKRWNPQNCTHISLVRTPPSNFWKKDRKSQNYWSSQIYYIFDKQIIILNFWTYIIVLFCFCLVWFGLFIYMANLFVCFFLLFFSFSPQLSPEKSFFLSKNMLIFKRGWSA